MSTSITNQPTRADAQKALLGMFTCFNVGGDELERKARHDAYWAVLAGVPLNAVIAACRDAARGNIGDRCFVPTAAMLYQRALIYLPKPSSHSQLPPVREIPPDEQARVKAGLKAFASELRATAPSDEPTRSSPRRLGQAVSGSLSQLSPEALKRFA